MKERKQNVKVQSLISFIIVFICLFFATQSIAKPVSKIKAAKTARAFLEIEQLRENRKGEKLTRDGRKLLKSIQSHEVKNIVPIYGGSGTLLAWVTRLNPEGYVITSADDNIDPVIAYSFESKFPFQNSKQNVLLQMVQWDMETRLNAFNRYPDKFQKQSSENNKQWADYESGGVVAMETMLLAEVSSTQTQWPEKYRCEDCGYRTSSWWDSWVCPECSGFYLGIEEGWIVTDWSQSGTYNSKCPYEKAYESSSRRPVGCVATATSQILNYWRYPKAMDFDESDHYDEDGIDYDGDSLKYGFPQFGVLDNNLNNIIYDGESEEIAYINFGVGIKLKMDYGVNGSGSNTAEVASVLTKDFSYGSAIAAYDYGGMWTKYENIVINSIKNGKPVQIATHKSEGKGSHSVIVDGYKNDGFFHVNFGWGGSATSWYNLPSSYNGYDIVHTIVYDICPYQSWNQSGADEKSTFRTIYNAPTTNPLKDKWQATCRSDYSFDGLAVGTGGKIYASCSPNNGGGDDHPSLHVINQYGEKEKEIPFPDENEGITYPAQNSRGEIFVSTDLGKVYRVDTKTDTATRIFTEPDGEQFFYPVKIDKDDNIYVATFYKLYSLTRTGGLRWTFPLPNNVWFFYRQPAIDSARDRVYIGYYDFDTDIPYLASINRDTGTELHRQAFPSVTMVSQSTGIPSVGEDGTVYVGCYTKLHALQSDTLTQKWETPAFRSKITRAPAIGSDGTLYVPYWNERGGTWYLAFGAFNSTDGSKKWEVERVSYDDYDNYGQPYIASNNVVVFPFLMENGSNPDTVEIYAYRDNGTSYEHLWNKNFNTSGGEFAFGPGATLYAWPTSGYGHTIYAVSEGDVGDPDGGGMAFTDNARPSVPETPHPIDGANDVNSTVTLSWSCSDPEGHSVKYSLFVGESGYDMVPVATDITSTSYQLTGLESSTSYRWMIVATDGQAVSDGPKWGFTTDVSADIYKDDKINLQDYAVLARNWQVTDCNELNDWCGKADIDKSGVVDFNDLLIMAEQWLAHGTTVPATFVSSYNGSSPTIDGVLSDGEWGSSYTVTMDRVDGGGQHDIDLYFQHDVTYLFVGVDSQWESGWDVVWDIFIDGDCSRTLNGNLSQPYTDIGICQQSPTGYSGYRAYRTMPDLSGVRVGFGSGADCASSGSTNVSYEFRVPLADLDVIPEASVGFTIGHGYDGVPEHLYELSLSVSRTAPENWATLELQPRLDDGLVAYYKLDGTSGPVIDETGNNDGVNNGATRGAVGKVGNAFEFNGINSWVESSLNAGITGNTDWTISFWLYTDHMMDAGNLVSLGTASFDYLDQNKIIGVAPGKANTELFVNLWSYSQNEYFDVGVDLTGSWNHIAVTYNGTNIEFFVNGVSKKSKEVVLDLANDKIRIGGEPGGYTGAGEENVYFDGWIDEVRIYNRTLSPSEVQCLFQNP